MYLARKNLLYKLVPDWKDVFFVNHLHASKDILDVSTILKNFSELFKDKLGCCNGPEVELCFRKLEFHKARPVPYASLSAVKQE